MLCGSEWRSLTPLPPSSLRNTTSPPLPLFHPASTPASTPTPTPAPEWIEPGQPVVCTQPPKTYPPLR